MTKSEETGGKAKFSARMAAVQALYEHSQNNKPIKDLIPDYLSKRPDGEGTDEIYSQPDGLLLKNILKGVDERHDDLNEMIKANLGSREVEPLLYAVLLAGAYEAMAHHDIDFAIIINDYLNITHSFYESSEAKLINGVLDKIARSTR